MNRSELKEIVRQELAMSKEKSTEINEATEVEIKSLDKKSQLAIKYWAGVFQGKPLTAWDGIHGIIVKIKVQSILKMRIRSEKLEYLMKSGAPKFRWIEFDKGAVDIGF